MAIAWTATLKEGEQRQVKYSVKSDAKTTGIYGTIPIDDATTVSSPVVDWAKNWLGSSLCTQFEEEATNIDDTLPTPET
tara:strand:- start:67 stop:303 length:237 start_codon:yes stop_codon:yes gene_type:complete